ncbi:flagellar hook-associated protein FlgK [Bacillaceae bacterium W0354]
MTSTFHGLEVARRALFTQQSALYTTGHNIANANTEGYSRQRVNFEQTSAYPAPGRNRPEIPGQLGTGVKAGQIERIRDTFLDYQYRIENNKAGYWGARADALGRMEDIMNDPSEAGFGKVMDQFWESIQVLATHPEDEGARKVVLQRATAVTDTFNYLHKTLTGVQGEIRNQLDKDGLKVNSLLSQIQELNDQIGRIEPNGYLPNDLYDKRDVLIDELSQYVDITVDYEPSGGRALDTAMGKAVIILNGANGEPHSDDIKLIDENNDVKGIQVTFDNTNGTINQVLIGALDKDGKVASADHTIAPGNFPSQGALKGLIESHDDIYATKITELDDLAEAFIDEFNRVHGLGTDLDGNAGQDFFGGTGAASISVIINNAREIAASADGYPGDGSHALELAKVRNTGLVGATNTSIQKFYEGMIGEIGVMAQEANRMVGNSEILRQSVEANRQSVSGVSLDEEMTNMIKFQHAYNAAARNMTVVDEMLDRIINQMGIVGR